MPSEAAASRRATTTDPIPAVIRATFAMLVVPDTTPSAKQALYYRLPVTRKQLLLGAQSLSHSLTGHEFSCSVTPTSLVATRSDCPSLFHAIKNRADDAANDSAFDRLSRRFMRHVFGQGMRQLGDGERLQPDS